MTSARNERPWRCVALALSVVALFVVLSAIQIDTSMIGDERVLVELSVLRTRPSPQTPATPAHPGTDEPPGAADTTAQMLQHTLLSSDDTTERPATTLMGPQPAASSGALVAHMRNPTAGLHSSHSQSKYFPRTDCNRSGCHGVQFPGPTPPLRTQPEDTVLLPSLCIDENPSLSRTRENGLHRVGGRDSVSMPECRLLCINTPTCIAWQHGTPTTTTDDPLRLAPCGLFGQLM